MHGYVIKQQLSQNPTAHLDSSHGTPVCRGTPFGNHCFTVWCMTAACSVVAKLLDLDLQGRWLNPWCGHSKISTAVGPLSKALIPTLLQGVCLLLSLINCKSLWIKSVSWMKKLFWLAVISEVVKCAPRSRVSSYDFGSFHSHGLPFGLRMIPAVNTPHFYSSIRYLLLSYNVQLQTSNTRRLVASVL